MSEICFIDRIQIRKLLMILVILGFFIRLGLGFKQGLFDAPKPGSDQADYETLAYNLYNGKGYRGPSPDVTDPEPRTARVPPGTSVTWAALYCLFGRSFAMIRIFHCVLSAVTVILVYYVGKEAFSRVVGLAGALIFTFWPMSLLFSVELLSETLGVFWLYLAIWASLRFASSGSAVWAVASGLSFGGALLVRANIALLMPMLGIWAIITFRKRLKVLVTSILIPLCVLLMLSPWVYRNYKVFGAFVPLTSTGGSSLLQGNNRITATDPKYYGYAYWDSSLPEYREQLRAPNNEFERDRVAKQLAKEWLSDNKDKWFYLAQAKLRRAFTPFLQADSPLIFRVGMLLAWGPFLVLLIVLFIPTLAAAVRNASGTWLLHLLIAQYALSSVIFFGYARYRFPVEPAAILISLGGLSVYLMRFDWFRTTTRRIAGHENKIQTDH
ncbi:MAG: glycosyltransferase family 39 protein [Verrucomicrobiota bacterium]|nr:glycosyltransferase family 39 protein [Verrucomicrobiota bacterium]